MEYRLNRYISSSGICSRREADKFIENGSVTVNGKRATLGMRVLPGQRVKVNGQLVEPDIEPVYIVYNKPVGVVTTTDTQERNNIIDQIGHQQRIFPVGRLDKDSQGLILLTNDGEIVNKILRAGNNHKKVYMVTVDKPIDADFVKKMSQGVPILDRVTRKCDVKLINPHLFEITLTQGLNRQIRRMCEYFGYEVTKLERIQIMDMKLGTLAVGDWRDLKESELERLFDMIEASEKTDEKVKNAPKKNTPKRPTTPSKRENKDRKENRRPNNERGKSGATKPKRGKR